MDNNIIDKQNQQAYTKEKWILGGASGRMITTKSGYFGDGFIADVDTKSNAEFICKACNEYESLVKENKELLEALKEITDQFEKVVEPKYTLDYMLIKEAREAIKKHSPIN